MSAVDIVVLALVALVLALAILRVVRRKHAGGSCCGDCVGCGAQNRCPEQAKKQ